MWQASENKSKNKNSKVLSELEEYGKFLKNKNLINSSNLDQRFKEFEKYKQYEKFLRENTNSIINDVEPKEYEETIKSF